jgi:hypothetical protein
MDWWLPFAIIGAILAGVAIAFAVAIPRRITGAASPPPAPQARGTRFDYDNRVSWNPVAFLVVLTLVGGITALAVVLAVV